MNMLAPSIATEYAVRTGLDRRAVAEARTVARRLRQEARAARRAARTPQAAPAVVAGPRLVLGH